MNFRKELLDSIRDKVDIVEYISAHVDLVRRGDSYLGLCPFHPDTSPSMRVHPQRKIFKCFGCGEGGSVITFAMKFHEIAFPEAVESLAVIAGIPLPETEDSTHVDRMLKYLEDMKGVYVGVRRSSSTVKDILRFPDEILDLFEVGLAPSNMVPFDSDTAREVGMLTETGRPYFQNRIMFPIKNPTGQVIGFYGRSLSNDGVKHLNSRNSRVFKKSSALFGFYQSKTDIRSKKEVVLVEGPKDLLALWSIGIHNVVATCGTALSNKQAQMITNAVNRVTLMYDSDPGGYKAAVENTKTLLTTGAHTNYVLLGVGKDPYDCYLNHSLQVHANNTLTLPEFLTAYLPRSTPAEKVDFIKELISIIEYSRNSVLHYSMIERAAQILDLPTSVVWEQFAQRPYRMDLGSFRRKSDTVISEHWQQITLGLSYAPIYVNKVVAFLENQIGDYTKPLEILKCMVDNKIESQAQWLDLVSLLNLNIPVQDDTLDMMSEPEIAEYIETATRTIVGFNLMEFLKKSIATADSESAERIKKCLTSLQSIPILNA